MRTTIRLPDDLHEQTKSLARDTGQTLSSTIVMLLRRALARDARPDLVEGVDGLLISRGGQPVTAEDVRALDDD